MKKDDTEDDDVTYKIVRFYHPSAGKEDFVVRTGLSLEDAQKHCSDPASEGPEFFDGYMVE